MKILINRVHAWRGWEVLVIVTKKYGRCFIIKDVDVERHWYLRWKMARRLDRWDKTRLQKGLRTKLTYLVFNPIPELSNHIVSKCPQCGNHFTDLADGEDHDAVIIANGGICPDAKEAE